MYTLEGVDGNAFFIMGYVTRAMKKHGLGDEVDGYRAAAMSGNYDNVLVVSMLMLDRINETLEKDDDDDDD